MKYIEKESLLKKAKEHAKSIFGAALIVAEIEKADEVELKHGEWSVAIGYDINKKVKCSVCERMTYEPTNFCPHCSADMRGDTE